MSILHRQRIERSYNLMMQPAPIVVVTWPGFDPQHDPGAKILRQAGADIVLAPKTGARSTAELATLMEDATGAVVSTDPFDRDVLARSPKLRIIARVGVGTDSIDLDTATEQGVLVATTPGANSAVVAEHTLALMLAAIRRVVEHDTNVRAGRWDRVGPMTSGQLAGRTVGIVGFGAIGQGVAERLAGFGVRILVHDRLADRADGYELVELDGLFARSDIVTIHVPLDDTTRGLIDAARIARMPRGSILVDTARGGVVDEAALADAIGSGQLAGAGLDVFEAEPPGESPLLSLSRVVLSPHIAGLSHQSIAEMTSRACRSVATVLDGGMPQDVINPQARRRDP